MKLPQQKLRQKLLFLLVGVGFVGMLAFAAVIVTADYQIFARFVPENQALRDVESRSARLVQDYYRFMLTPELINLEVLEQDKALIRQSLAGYRRLTESDSEKQKLADNIARAIDGLENAGGEMVAARAGFTRVYERQEEFEEAIDIAFQDYLSKVSTDLAESIDDRQWSNLVSADLPDLRMIHGVKELLLQLFLEIREYQANPNSDALDEIDELVERIDVANTMLVLNVENDNVRADESGEILEIFTAMLETVSSFVESRRRAEFAVSRAEQSGIDLSQAIVDAIIVSESVGWKDLRNALFLSGAILIATLIASYLIIYRGLDRVLQPLEELQMVISRLGKGDFQQRAKDIDRGDEIGQLAQAFNRMADQLSESVEQKQHFIDQLEQQNMELERFTYTVSHELKSPLVTVSGFVGLLERDIGSGDDERVDADLAKIRHAVNTMSGQLEDLLELSRVGRVVNPSERISMTRLCTEVVELMQGLIDERDAKIEVEPDMPDVFVDQARIREVVKNLVENGIKYANGGAAPHIVISAEESGERVLCRVRDNGPGIDPQYREKVFGLFDRLDNEVSGSGVGLALVKRIVEIHAGNIWIESLDDGQGCSFCFTLPQSRGI